MFIYKGYFIFRNYPRCIVCLMSEKILQRSRWDFLQRHQYFMDIRTIIWYLKSALTFFERDRFEIITMCYRDVFIDNRTSITGQIKGLNPYYILKRADSRPSRSPSMIRCSKSIAVLQYGCTIDTLYIRPIQDLQNLGGI